MVTFEDFAIRAKLDLHAYFRANNISSDASLREYCLANNMVPPVQVYFPEKQENKIVQVDPPKKPVRKKAKVLKEEKPPAKTPAKRKTRTTRKRTTKTQKK